MASTNKFTLVKDVKLKSDGSNVVSWLFKLTRLARLYKLDMLFKFRINDEENNALSSSKNRKKLLALTDEDLKEATRRPANEEKKNNEAYTLLCLSLADEHIDLIKNLPPIPSVALCAILERFSPTDTLTVQHIYDELASLDIREEPFSGSVDKLATKIESLSRRLSEQGERPTDSFLVNKLLSALLPDSDYKIIKLLVAGEDATFKEAVTKLKNIIRRMPNGESKLSKQSAMINIGSKRKINRRSTPRNANLNRPLVSKRSGRWKKNNKANGKKKRFNIDYRNVTCYICGVKGHMARDCYKMNRPMSRSFNSNIDQKRRNERLKQINRQVQNMKMQIAKLKNFRMKESKPNLDHELSFTLLNYGEQEHLCPLSKNIFKPGRFTVMLDSGASSHFFNNESYFDELWQTKQPILVHTGKKGQSYELNRKGTVTLIFELPGDSEKVITLTDVWFAPQCPVNIMSQSKIDKHGYKIISEKGIMKVRKNGQLYAVAKMNKEGIYLVDCRQCDRNRPETVKEERISSETCAVSLAEHLHQKLNHASLRRIRKTYPHVVGLRLAPSSTFICPACDLTKSIRVRTNFDLRRSNPHRISVDLKGPLPRSLRGYKYFCIIIHEGSHHITVGLLRNKSEAADVIREYLIKIKRVGRIRVNELRSDGGGEFTSSQFLQEVNNAGIRTSMSTAYRPQENSMAERGIRTIMDAVRSTLRHANLPQSYWCYSAQAAAYVNNRLTCSGTPDSTPHEEFSGERPNIKNIVTFGCIGVAHVPKQTRKGPLSDRGEFVRMLGYDERHKTYIVRNKENIEKRVKVDKWYESTFVFPKFKSSVCTSIDAKFRRDDTQSHTASIGIANDQKDIDTDLNRDFTATEEASGQDDVPEPVARHLTRTNRGVPSAKYGFTYINVEESLASSEINSEQKVISVAEIENVPRTYRQAVNGPERDKWSLSIKSEYDSLIENKTWSIVDRPPPEVNVVSSKWVFRKKTRLDGRVRYKSRLVARGFTQRKGEDYFYTYSPTLSLTSFRALLAIASEMDLNLYNIDITTAFLYGKVEGCNIYMEIPDGFSRHAEYQNLDLNNKVLKLRKTIYGLKQSAAAFNEELSKTLIQAGLRALLGDACVFVDPESKSTLIVATYVDDCVILYKEKKQLKRLLEIIGKRFKYKDIGKLDTCLGIDVLQVPGGYAISQSRYIKRMGEKYEITCSKRAKTPLPAHIKLDEYQHSAKVDSTTYRSMIGAVLYASGATRPDVTFAISKLSQYSADPRLVHMNALKRLIRYMMNTCEYKMIYTKTGKLPAVQAYADASFGSDLKTGKSISGYLIFIAGAPVLWMSKRQRCVTTSTSESEYVALSGACREIIYIHGMLTELGLERILLNKTGAPPEIKLGCDSASAIAVSEKPGLSLKSRSIRISYHNVRSCVKEKLIKLVKVKGTENPADMLTKPLPKTLHYSHLSRMFPGFVREYINLAMISHNDDNDDGIPEDVSENPSDDAEPENKTQEPSSGSRAPVDIKLQNLQGMSEHREPEPEVAQPTTTHLVQDHVRMLGFVANAIQRTLNDAQQRIAHARDSIPSILNRYQGMRVRRRRTENKENSAGRAAQRRRITRRRVSPRLNRGVPGLRYGFDVEEFDQRREAYFRIRERDRLQSQQRRRTENYPVPPQRQILGEIEPQGNIAEPRMTVDAQSASQESRVTEPISRENDESGDGEPVE